MAAGLQSIEYGVAKGGVLGHRPIAVHAVCPCIGIRRGTKHKIRLTRDCRERIAEVGLHQGVAVTTD
jgi:hypothetical protein